MPGGPPRIESRQLLEQRPRRRDTERHILHAQALVGRVDVRVGERKAGDDRRDAPLGQRRGDRESAAGAGQRRPHPEHPLERTQAELDGRRVGRDERGRGGGEQLDLELGARRRGGAQEPVDLGRDLVGILAGRQPDRQVRVGAHRDHRLLGVWRAGLDPVDVERRLGERPHIEVLGRPRVGRPRALVGQLAGAGR
jgi:hypothetical protein